MIEIHAIPARLRAVREAASIQIAGLASTSGLAADSLEALETGARLPSSAELDALARALGLSEPELLADELPAPTAVGALARGGLETGLSEHLGRFVSIARERQEVVRALGWSSEIDLDEFEPAGAPRDPAWAQTEALAEGVRQKLALGIGPIRSVVDLVESLGVHLLWTRALAPSVRGLSLVDERRFGRAIVLNLADDAGDYWVQRSTLAHELCHTLFDRVRGQPIGVVSRKGKLEREPLEQRANAFACYLLVPREGARRFLFSRGKRKGDALDQNDVHSLANYYGVGIQLLTDHLVHLGYLRRDEAQALAGSNYPFDDALDTESPERRGSLAPWIKSGVDLEHLALIGPVAEALARGLVTEGAARELLGLSPFDALPGGVGAGLP